MSSSLKENNEQKMARAGESNNNVMTRTFKKAAPSLNKEAIYNQEANVTANDTSQEVASVSERERRRQEDVLYVCV